MRIVIATPLYPPDIAEPAPYVKELAKRLSHEHTVTIVAYGRLPEQVSGVRVIGISKRNPLPIRLMLYTLAVAQAAMRADIIYMENGPSVELPVGLIVRLMHRTLVIHMGDKAAHMRATQSRLLRNIEHFALRRGTVVTDTPLPRPEIMPLEPRPDVMFKTYEQSWQPHLEILKQVFSHGE